MAVVEQLPEGVAREGPSEATVGQRPEWRGKRDHRNPGEGAQGRNWESPGRMVLGVQEEPEGAGGEEGGKGWG